MARSQLELEDFLPYRLSIASNAVSQVIARSYERLFELKMHEWRVVAVLAEHGELTQQQIVGRTKMDKVTVSRAAQVLGKRGFVRRAPNMEDARSWRLSLTAEGRKLHARVTPQALTLESDILKDLSPREITDLKKLLRLIEASADQVLVRR